MKEKKQIKIMEVGPRDGLQNQKKIIPTEDKIEFIKLLLDAGIQSIEVTSFVNPKKVPQLADADKLFESLQSTFASKYPEVAFIPLIPNMKGLENAIKHRPKEIAVLTAASDSFNKKNIGLTVDQSIKILTEIIELCSRKGIRVRGSIAMAFVCPYEGPILVDKLIDLIQTLISMGCYEVCLADTAGLANEEIIESTLDSLKEVIDLDNLAMHFHDVKGSAITNVQAALKQGIKSFDSSVANLGGCPFVDNANKNLSTEEMVSLCQKLGYQTGINLEILNSAASFIRNKLTN